MCAHEHSKFEHDTIARELDAFAAARVALMQAENDACRRTLLDLHQERAFALSEYEARALKRILENIGGAIRWGVKPMDKNPGCNGDWGHQIYAKLLSILDGK